MDILLERYGKRVWYRYGWLSWGVLVVSSCVSSNAFFLYVLKVEIE